MNTMTTVTRLRTVIAATLFGAVAAGFAALPAIADNSDVPHMTVKFGDLNISNPQGAAVLYDRIRDAANSVCGQEYSSGGIDILLKRVCIEKAIEGAVTKVNAPALSALYSGKTGKEVPTRLASASK